MCFFFANAKKKQKNFPNNFLEFALWVAQQTKTNLGQVIEVEHKTRTVLTLARGRGMRGLNDKQY